jgi:hypothetical protein
MTSRRRPQLFVAIALMGAACLLSSMTRAQGSDPAAAADLFREGRDALAAKNYELACAKFAESQRLEARVGTLINLAQCEEQLNRLASARQHWEEATDLGRATSDPRVAYTTEHFDAIDKRVPRLVVRVVRSAPADTVVHRDDVELGHASLGTPLPLDPGKYTVVAAAIHHADGVAVVVELAEGESKDVTVEPGPLLPEQPPTPTPATVAPVRSERPGGRSPLWYGAIASGAVGIIGLGIGTYLGIQAINGKNSDGCNGDVCIGDAKTKRDSALQAGNESTVAFVTGGVFLAAGIALWVLAPSRTATRAPILLLPSADGRSALASITGRF